MRFLPIVPVVFGRISSNSVFCYNDNTIVLKMRSIKFLHFSRLKCNLSSESHEKGSDSHGREEA